MENNVLMMSILMVALMSYSPCAIAVRPCGNCGRLLVPYPLSTRPDCGDQHYKLRCTAGTLWFDGVNGSSYTIKTINPLIRRLIIQPPNLANNSCISSDFHSQGIQLDHNLPFNISSSNTILLLNCTDSVSHLKLNPPMDCSPASICHNYIKEHAAACIIAPLCCTFRTGGLQNVDALKVYVGECSAYQSFVNLDLKTVLALNKWPEPEVEIEWMLPQEPVCRTPVDCRELLYSKCLADPIIFGQKRCFCNAGFKWDPINGLCQNVKCRTGKACRKRKKKTALFAGVALAGGAILLVAVTGILFYNQHHRSRQAQKNLIKERKEMLNAKHSGKSARIFTGKEIIKATNNFSKDNLIGSGGFGEVFKGILDDGTITAIKRAKLGNTKGTDQVLNEVRILCQVNHRSLVRLLGCCVELELPIMIYEYIPNGTLFEHLHCNQSSKWTPLPWQRRLRIAHQTAEGLAYLHSAALPPIYHRDVKSSNILLDERLNAKVSDFGLSRLVETSENNDSHIFTCAQGTLGYLDPEYYRNFQLTDKSDVYSFGVVLMEILTSKKAIDFNREEEDVNLVVYMKKMIEEDRILDAIDPVLKESASKLELETMKALGSLAATCLDEKRQNRPSMKEVADEIQYIIGITSERVSKS
ncbi:wall-associated receptor kinase-like 20 [Ricinus communis]|uniref:Kinase, putative n=1 Tax=Ricinus communis TaxID=3988 RepID=B9SV56_RICCO|nr:wall-associated receptor kinase-like 20 [Ricinus communis]EEF32525.1 kinase, putative [Ricinus communis]|eukprot:XP_002529875.1 wall-associated receptor kinase-like 20 [Ricinus communis]